ncbi:winged helix-turn-helix domain-containing protein [Gordonia otitidis]|nr:winged helix-turn-helix domain-containing protein [Gordonia otitidis]
MAWPALQAMIQIGRPATNDEVLNAVATALNLTPEQRQLPASGGRTLLSYRLSWSRTLLKQIGAVEIVSPHTWTVTDRGRAIAPEDIRRKVDEYLSRVSKPKAAN